MPGFFNGIYGLVNLNKIKIVSKINFFLKFKVTKVLMD